MTDVSKSARTSILGVKLLRQNHFGDGQLNKHHDHKHSNESYNKTADKHGNQSVAKRGLTRRKTTPCVVDSDPDWFVVIL